MRDLSVLIPARCEEWLSRTIADVLEHSEADTEVIAVLDGAWADPPIPDNPCVRLVHVGKSIGQRAACNLAARMSTARFIMKLDAHCSVGQGFDRILMENCDYDWTVIPHQFNFHVFDWVCKKCGARFYQGPPPHKIDRNKTDKSTLKALQEHDTACGATEYERDIVWKRREGRHSIAWCFDSELKYQPNWGDFTLRPEAKPIINDTMTLLGACWFLHRERYWELGGSDETTGSWGQQGVEIACKTWLSGGRLVCNKNTWYAHLFRTQGPAGPTGFSFPYPISGSDQDKARRYSQKLWREGLWPGMKRPLSSLVEQFWPVKGWTDKDLDELKAVEAPKWSKAPVVVKSEPSKGLIYYTDNRLDEKLASAVRMQIDRSRNGHSLITASLKPLDWGENVVIDRQRSILTMYYQILAALERSSAEVVFMTEHDVLYDKARYEFTPPHKNGYFYNINQWKVDVETGRCLKYFTRQVSGLCAYRETLLAHYRKRIAKIEQNAKDLRAAGLPVKREGFSIHMGHEPGCHSEPRGVDNLPALTWESPIPDIDLRHNTNLTANRWDKSQFRNPKSCEGWTEADEVPGWPGPIKGRFWEFLDEVTK